MPDIDPQIQKEAVKEAIKEWITDRAAEFGVFSFKTILYTIFAGAAYLWLASHGWVTTK